MPASIFAAMLSMNLGSLSIMKWAAKINEALSGKPLGASLLEDVQLFGGFPYRPAEIGHAAAVRLMGTGHELGMALPPYPGHAACKTAGDMLPLDKSQIAHRPFGNTAHALKIHEQPGIFQYRGQLGAGGLEGRDVGGLKIIGQGVLHHQDADLDHALLDGYGQKGFVGQFIRFREIAEPRVFAGVPLAYRRPGGHHGSHQPLAGAHAHPVHRFRIEPDSGL